MQPSPSSTALPHKTEDLSPAESKYQYHQITLGTARATACCRCSGKIIEQKTFLSDSNLQYELVRLEDMALFFGYKLHARDVSAEI
jgi:hypothetical protein